MIDFRKKKCQRRLEQTSKIARLILVNSDTLVLDVATKIDHGDITYVH